MAAAESDHSHEFVRAAQAEADRLRLDAERRREEAARYLALAETATAEAISLERRVRELDELLGRAPQLRIDLQGEALRGQRLREAAIQIVAKQHKIGESIHYRDWFKLVLAEGHTVEGKDPLATFLTQVTRSPVVLRQPERSGIYRVDPDEGGERALRELERAKAELLELRQRLPEVEQQADEGDTAFRDRVATAQRRVGAAERALSEVARVQATLHALAS